MAKLILFNKPYGVLSQFSDAGDRATLGDYIDMADMYPAGRLDRDSEGLLLLTDEGKLQHNISHPDHKLPKTYWVQVEGTANEAAIDRLRRGVALKDGMTAPVKAGLIQPPPIGPRQPPVRRRNDIPTSWLQLTLTEGRNRQVRRMTAAVGFPTLRLIRTRIGGWSLEGLAPGQFRLETVYLPAVIPPRRPHSRKRRWIRGRNAGASSVKSPYGKS